MIAKIIHEVETYDAKTVNMPIIADAIFHDHNLL
jgi:hypothetical protein